MQALMWQWQEDLVGVAKFVNACSNKMNLLRVKHLISLVWLEEMYSDLI